MSFKDIFKKSFLEGYASSEITTVTIVAALAVACVLALALCCSLGKLYYERKM